MQTKPNVLKILALTASLMVSRNVPSAVAAPLVQEGDVIAICGDSITEQKLYSVFIEDYLRMCQTAQVKVVQFGWGGETAQGFLNRMKEDVLPIKPTLATTCYGMNDGRYTAVTDDIRKNYREPLMKVVENFRNAGARVIVGSPGAVDYDAFRRTNTNSEIYNNNLATLGLEAKAIAEATGQTFANVQRPMLEAMYAAKQKYGRQYHVAGGDGFHPAANGHLAMAYAFIKAMGFDGEIGTFTVDLNERKVTATAGHEVAADATVNGDSGSFTVTSTIYPFCFSGETFSNPTSTAGIVEFLPFNQELNRLTLKVVGAKGAKYKVTWGEQSKEFTGEQLTAGINLAAEFLLNNPFSEPFSTVERAIREKQQFETAFFKNILRTVNQHREKINDEPAITGFINAWMRRHAELEKAAIEAKKPVTHTIKIEPVQ